MQRRANLSNIKSRSTVEWVISKSDNALLIEISFLGIADSNKNSLSMSPSQKQIDRESEKKELLMLQSSIYPMYAMSDFIWHFSSFAMLLK